MVFLSVRRRRKADGLWRSRRLTLWLVAALAVFVLLPDSASSDTASADIAVSLSGPNHGQVGDTLTFSVIATNKGPDDTDALVSFVMQKAGLSLVDWTPHVQRRRQRINGSFNAATPSPSVPRSNFRCARMWTRSWRPPSTELQARSPGTTRTRRTTRRASPFSQSRLNRLRPRRRHSAVAPPAPPYGFVDALADATQYSDYFQDSLRCLNDPFCSANVAVVGGEVPPGLKVSPYGGSIQGKPFTPGTYTFTLEARPDSTANNTTIRHEFTIKVAPYDQPPDPAVATRRPPASLVGKTVLLTKKTRSTGCKPRALPDRRCSPGAYYSKMTKVLKDDEGRTLRTELSHRESSLCPR